MHAPTGLKVYPDQAELHSRMTKERLISQKIQNFALVASQAGEYVLPKISISWWNTVTNKYQQAILAEQTITVQVERRFTHPVLKKTIRSSKKYRAHDESNTFKVGDMVRIQECAPKSKSKRWEVIAE